jgi:hypothetical protein
LVALQHAVNNSFYPARFSIASWARLLPVRFVNSRGNSYQEIAFLKLFDKDMPFL